MRVVIQRVSQASVTINEKITASIGNGMLILLGIEAADDENDIDWLCEKITKLRIFNDENDVMNRSVQEINGEILVVSQFTLMASTKKGNRPSYINAAKPELAIPLYEAFLVQLKNKFSKSIQSGTFGADMKINLLNDGPVTIIIDSKNKE